MSDFQILSDKDHVLTRPGMYIGSTEKEPRDHFIMGKWKTISYVPGLIKICNEIIDNSIDEAIRTKFKYANKIAVSVKDNEVMVTDNGRGIPQDEITDIDGSKILRPVAAWTKAKAGTSFSDDRETIGANGVGSALTNFFSLRFEGTTCDGKTAVTVKCSHNAERVFVSKEKSTNQGTTVKFIPDFNRFGVNALSDDDIAILEDRVHSLAVIFPQINFTFNGNRIKSDIKKYAEMYGSNIVISEKNISAFVFPCDEFKQVSFVNGVNTFNGGAHTDYFIRTLVAELQPLIKKQYKIDVPTTMIKNGMGIGLMMNNFQNPKFDSQTKEKLTNAQSEISNHLSEIDYGKLSRQILKCSEIIDPIIETLLAKRYAEEQRELKKKQKAVKKKTVYNHVSATKPGGTLILTEGKSAIGYLLKVRNREKIGGLPLRGKVLNTWGMKANKILENAELSDIISSLNLELGVQDISGMYYNDIAIMTDADYDGIGSIFPLLLAFFYNWKDLYKQQRVKFIKTPVVIATKGKDIKWFYSLDDYENSKLGSSYNIRYIKGLGSLTEKEYGQIINDPVYDVVTVDDANGFELLFGNDADKRKAWMSGN